MTVSTDKPLKPLVGINELARESGICEQTLRLHLESGEWPGLRVGRRGSWRVPRGVLDALKAGVDPSTLKATPPVAPAPAAPPPPVPASPPPAPAVPDWLPTP